MPYRIGKLRYLSCCYTSPPPFVSGSAPCSALDPALLSLMPSIGALSLCNSHTIASNSTTSPLPNTYTSTRGTHHIHIYIYTCPQANYPMNQTCANFVTQRSPSRAAPAARTPCARRPASRSARGSSGSAPGSRCPVGTTAPGNGDTGTASPPTPHPLQILLLPSLSTHFYVIYVLLNARCVA